MPDMLGDRIWKPSVEFVGMDTSPQMVNSNVVLVVTIQTQTEPKEASPKSHVVSMSCLLDTINKYHLSMDGNDASGILSNNLLCLK